MGNRPGCRIGHLDLGLKGLLKVPLALSKIDFLDIFSLFSFNGLGDILWRIRIRDQGLIDFQDYTVV